MSRLDRLRRLTREEVEWRLRSAGRIQRDRLRARLRTPRWDRRALRAVLACERLDSFVAMHIDREEWSAAQEALARGFASRRSTFLIDPARCEELRHTILSRFPAAAGDAAGRADAIREGRFDLLGYRQLTFGEGGGSIDWHLDPVHGRRPPMRFWADVPYLDPACGDHKVIWELNRHQHWLVLGRAMWLTRNRDYGWTMITQLEDWLAANPPLQGVNWASMLELGFRAMSWVWGLHFLLADLQSGHSQFSRSPWLLDLLLGLDRQLSHVEQNLSYYFSPNTHLTGEALALYVTGRTVPELAASARWAAVGRDVLLREIETQIGRDGGHAERSMHYHRYTLDFYLLALLVAERSGDREAIEPFRDAVDRLATFARGMADEHGRLPMIGDDDGGMLWPIAGRNPADVRDSLALAAVALGRPELVSWQIPEETYWLWGGDAALALPHPGQRRGGFATLFADTGYAVMNTGDGHLTFDVGAHGFLNGGHAHADALAVTVALGGTPLLIDPGTATYTMDPALRDRMRAAASHNTVIVDGVEPSRPSGPFHWRTRADGQLTAWRGSGRFAWAEADHNGYRDTRHRRSVVMSTDAGALIVDDILGRGRHGADVHWHFDPTWMVTCEDKQTLRATHFDGRVAWLLHDEGALTLVHGDEESGRGWCAPAYGTLVPTWSARFGHHVVAPASLVTWIGEARRVVPTLTRLAIDADPAAAIVAVAVRHDAGTTITALRSGDSPGRARRSCATRDFHSDGRLLQYTLDHHGRLSALAVADATHALALRDGLISVAADGQVGDLHVAFAGEAIEITASAPPPRLQLQGAGAASARMLRLNGRELPVAGAGRGDDLVVHGAEWGETVTDARTKCVA